MSDNSRIEWTDATWNFVVGCTKVSSGCDNCYAERDVNRWNGHGAFDTVTIKPEKLDLPLHWRRPRRVFVNSLSDLFHDAIPDEVIAQAFAVMALASRHTFQVLTKRHARMRSLLTDPTFCEEVAVRATDIIASTGPSRQRSIQTRGWTPVRVAGPPRRINCFEISAGTQWYAPWPLPNVWLGVSVEDQKWADIRVPALLDTPAAVRFLSCEPLLGPVDVKFSQCREHDFPGGFCTFSCPHRQQIHWVIVGGESGPKARPMEAEWAEQIRDHCEASSTAFFMKQAGAVLAREWGCTDRKGHNPAEWPDEFPRQMPHRMAVVA